MGTAARRELLAKCEELIKSFDPKKTTLDSHPINQKGDHELAVRAHPVYLWRSAWRRGGDRRSRPRARRRLAVA